MTPEQRARVNDLFAAALESIAGSTAPLSLDEEDEEVRKEVERLLRLHFERGSFLKTISESAPAPRFQPGELLAGRYRIIERVGHGGMGEVYRAEDSALGKIVALKTILPRFVGDEVYRYGASGRKSPPPIR